MLTKILRLTTLILLALSLYGVGQAADMAIDCRLKGGSVVQLPAAACAMEGGTQVNETAAPATPVSPAPAAAPEPMDKNAAKDQLPSGDAANNLTLTPAQKVIIDLLDKPVEATTPLNRDPEGIKRAAKFDGCHLLVGENIHIQLGNAYSVWKDFKINSVIDLQKIDPKGLGVWDKVGSKGGDLGGAAVYFEERKRKDGNNISISVLNLRDPDHAKYTVHGLSAYLSTPSDDLWIADEYGYPKDTGWGTVATDTIRILLIVKSPVDAAKLKSALEEVNAICKQQPN